MTCTDQIVREDVLEAISHSVEEIKPVYPVKNEDKKYKVQVKKIQKDMIEDALRKAKYNRAQTAAILGISTSTLWRKMKENNML